MDEIHSGVVNGRELYTRRIQRLILIKTSIVPTFLVSSILLKKEAEKLISEF